MEQIQEKVSEKKAACFSCRLNEHDLARLDALAKQDDRDRSSMVRRLIRQAAAVEL